MGATYVDVTIRNPAEPQRSWTGTFLVDTGACLQRSTPVSVRATARTGRLRRQAFDSLVPRARLEAIGLKPKGSREYTLADGTGISLEITTADLEFEGEVVGGTIVYGEDGAEPLLGVTALESGGFEVDPRNQELKRLPAVLLKGIHTCSKTVREQLRKTRNGTKKSIKATA